MAKRRDQGQGSVYQRADGRWLGVVDLGVVGGKRVRKTVSAGSRAECLRKFAALRRQVEGGVIPTNVTFGWWVQHWLDDIAPTRAIRPATLDGYRDVARRELLPLLGHVKLADLGPDHVRAMRGDMTRRGLSPTTIRNAHALARTICESAVEEQRKTTNPFKVVKAPNRSPAHHAALSVTDAIAVLQGAQTTREAVRLSCALLLGMRQGEALGLRWEHVHEADGWLEIAAAARRVKGEGMTLAAPKSSSSRRVLPLPDPLPALFARWRAESGGVGWVFGSPVVDAPVGTTWDWRQWKAALARAGVADVPLHGARATTATLLRAAGVSERIIADILGHADAQVTTDNYLRSSAAERAAALSGLAGALLSPER